MLMHHVNKHLKIPPGLLWPLSIIQIDDRIRVLFLATNGGWLHGKEAVSLLRTRSMSASSLLYQTTRLVRGHIASILGQRSGSDSALLFSLLLDETSD